MLKSFPLKFISCICLCILLCCSGWAQVCNFRLSGHLEDEVTHEKLGGATVSLLPGNKIVLTNDNGDFTITGLCEGKYSVVVTHIDHDTVSQDITLSKNQHLDLHMHHIGATLEEVSVTAQRGMANTGMKKEITSKELAQYQGLSLGEILSKLNGVTMLQTGSTITKPVIHGLHSARILTINNGVRQEGQQWGNEHAPEIDPYVADNLTVIKGVDELRYGSDAIGGVILINPKALRNKPGSSAEFNSAYFTNNREYVFSGMFEHQLKNLPALTYRLQGTFKKSANVASPDYRLNNTALEEKNFSATVGWKKSHYNIEAYYSQFQTKVGIFSGAHIGNLSDLLAAIASDKPASLFTGDDTYAIGRPYQDVTHRLVKLKSSVLTGGSRFNLLVAAQYNHRKEFDVVRSSTVKGPQLDLNIMTVSEDLSWDHPSIGNLKGSLGVSFIQQQNVYSGRYLIPNYLSSTEGAYLVEKWIRNKFELQGGLRYDAKTISTKRLLYGGGRVDHDFNYATFASSLNAIYKPDHHLQMNINVSLANRAPYVNELLSNGIHEGSGTYEEGDINLKTERALNFTTGLFWFNEAKTLSFDLALYANYIDNFIYQQPKPNDPVLTIAGAFPKLQYQQTDALLKGIDLTGSYEFLKALTLTSKMSLLRAYNRSADDWLILMPSDRFTNSLKYSFSEGSKLKDNFISAEYSNVLKQTRVPSDKNGKQDYKNPPDAYSLLGLTASTTVSIHEKPVTLTFGVSNLFNTAYREYLNSFRYFTDEMGRNFSLRLRWQFGNIIDKSSN